MSWQISEHVHDSQNFLPNARVSWRAKNSGGGGWQHDLPPMPIRCRCEWAWQRGANLNFFSGGGGSAGNQISPRFFFLCYGYLLPFSFQGTLSLFCQFYRLCFCVFSIGPSEVTACKRVKPWSKHENAFGRLGGGGSKAQFTFKVCTLLMHVSSFKALPHTRVTTVGNVSGDGDWGAIVTGIWFWVAQIVKDGLCAKFLLPKGCLTTNQILFSFFFKPLNFHFQMPHKEDSFDRFISLPSAVLICEWKICRSAHSSAAYIFLFRWSEHQHDQWCKERGGGDSSAGETAVVGSGQNVSLLASGVKMENHAAEVILQHDYKFVQNQWIGFSSVYTAKSGEFAQKMWPFTGRQGHWDEIQAVWVGLEGCGAFLGRRSDRFQSYRLAPVKALYRDDGCKQNLTARWLTAFRASNRSLVISAGFLSYPAIPWIFLQNYIQDKTI